MKPSSSHPATPSRSSHAARAACLVPRPGSLQAARCAHRTRGSSARLAVSRREPEAHLRGSCGPPSCTAQAPALQRTGQAGSAAAPRRARIHSSAHQVNAHAHRCRDGPPHLAPGGVQRRTPACPTHSQRTAVAMAFLIVPSRSPDTSMSHSCTAHRPRDGLPHLAPAGRQRRTPACPSRPRPRCRPCCAGLAVPRWTAPRWAALPRGWALWVRPAQQFYAAGQQASRRAHACYMQALQGTKQGAKQGATIWKRYLVERSHRAKYSAWKVHHKCTRKQWISCAALCAAACGLRHAARRGRQAAACTRTSAVPCAPDMTGPARASSACRAAKLLPRENGSSPAGHSSAECGGGLAPSASASRPPLGASSRLESSSSERRLIRQQRVPHTHAVRPGNHPQASPRPSQESSPAKLHAHAAQCPPPCPAGIGPRRALARIRA